MKLWRDCCSGEKIGAGVVGADSALARIRNGWNNCSDLLPLLT